MGEDGLRFYSYGIQPNHDNSMARRHADAWASKKRREEIARRMFRFRFDEVEVSSSTIQQLRGMEGRRVKFTYERLGIEYGVTWKGRDYNMSNWSLADGINRALSATNASLYALTSAVCLSMGFIPQLGFVHDGGTLHFIYDIADLYKHETSWPAAFRAIKENPKDDGTLARQLLKEEDNEADVRYYSVHAAASAIGVFPGTIYKWLTLGRLPGRQLGKGLPWIIPLTPEQINDVQRYVQRVRHSKKEAV